MRISPHKRRVCAVLAPRFPLEFYTRVFFAVLFFRLPFKFTRLYWSCFVVRIVLIYGIRLVNAGFVVVAGCFYSPGSACFMYLFLFIIALLFVGFVFFRALSRALSRAILFIYLFIYLFSVFFLPMVA